jgi:hypothetical protein|tara:strand:+ start:4218 stop:4508 length:291 start_codon:yes stop_codon:yes gene_type:complete
MFNSNLLSDCRKAVNQAKYSATAERKAKALALLTELTEAVTSLEVVKPKAKKKSTTKPKAKAKSKTSKARQVAEAKVSKVDLTKLTKKELLAMLSA